MLRLCVVQLNYGIVYLAILKTILHATPSNIAFVSFTMDKTMSLLLQNLNLIGKKKLF
jgi:hypothetical protein